MQALKAKPPSPTRRDSTFSAIPPRGLSRLFQARTCAFRRHNARLRVRARLESVLRKLNPEFESNLLRQPVIIIVSLTALRANQSWSLPSLSGLALRKLNREFESNLLRQPVGRFCFSVVIRARRSILRPLLRGFRHCKRPLCDLRAANGHTSWQFSPAR